MINPIVVYYQKKNESVQYNTGLAITDATRGTSKDKLYQDLNLWKTEGDRDDLFARRFIYKTTHLPLWPNTTNPKLASQSWLLQSFIL